MHELVHDGLPIEQRLLEIFDEGFEMKLEADYGNPDKIQTGDARAAIDKARRLIADITRILEAE